MFAAPGTVLLHLLAVIATTSAAILPLMNFLQDAAGRGNKSKKVALCPHFFFFFLCSRVPRVAAERAQGPWRDQTPPDSTAIQLPGSTPHQGEEGQVGGPAAAGVAERKITIN